VQTLRPSYLLLPIVLAAGLLQACTGGNEESDRDSSERDEFGSGGTNGPGDSSGGGGSSDENGAGGSAPETGATGGMGGETTTNTGGSSTGMGGLGTGGTPPVEICGDGMDNDGDANADCDDSDCAADLSCVLGCVPPEPYAPLSTAGASIPEAGLVLWVRADVGVGKTPENSVCVWEDQSGNGHHLSQETNSSRPVAGAILGGQSALDFDAGRRLLRDDVLGIGATSGRTFVVVATTKSLTLRAFFLYQGRSGDVGKYVGIDINSFNTSGQRFGAYMTNNAYDTNLATDLSPHVHTLLVSSMTPGDAVLDHMNYSVDGVSLALTRTAGGLGNTRIEDFSLANTTAVGTTSGAWADLTVAEVLIYDHALSSEDQGQVSSYLNTRYGL